MTRRDLVWASAYGAAFASRMERHGTPTSHTEPDPAGGNRLVVGTADARAEADKHARMVADAAVERSERA